MKSILFFISLCNFFFNSDHSKKSALTIIRVNLDTSNFRKRSFENHDLGLLVELKINKNEDIVPTNDNIILKSRRSNKRINIKTAVYYFPQYNSGDIKENNLKVKSGESIFFTISISCLEFCKVNPGYIQLNPPEKKEYLTSFLKNLIIFYDNEKIDYDIDKVKLSYDAIFYPTDPNKPNPLNKIIKH